MFYWKLNFYVNSFPEKQSSIFALNEHRRFSTKTTRKSVISPPPSPRAVHYYKRLQIDQSGKLRNSTAWSSPSKGFFLIGYHIFSSFSLVIFSRVKKVYVILIGHIAFLLMSEQKFWQQGFTWWNYWYIYNKKGLYD